MGFFSTIKTAIAKGVTAAAKVSVKTNSVVTNAAKSVAVGAVKGALTTVAAAKAKATSQKKNTQKNTKTNTTTTKAATSSSGGSSANNSTILIQWHDVQFYANASQVRGLTDLTISSSIETEDKENGGTKYVSKKNSKGYEISMKALFDARLGIKDVKKEAMALAKYGATGQTGYMYAKGEKLVTPILMMTSAKVSNIRMTPKGVWISAEIQITLKTCSKMDGSTSSSGGGGGGGGGGGYKYSVTVYYSGSSGAVSSVTGYSNISKADAEKKAYAKVPKTAQWASTTKKQATNQSPALTDKALQAARDRVAQSKQQQNAAKTQSQNSGTGITNRNNQVQQKKLDRVK